MARYNADGSPDLTYGDNDGLGGVTVVDFDTEDIYTNAVALPDGSVVLMGTTRGNTYQNYVPVLARLNPDGELDDSFGNHGKALLDLTEADFVPLSSFSNIYFQPYNVQLQADGSLLVAIGTMDFFQWNTVFASEGVIRILSDGTWDAGYKGIGIDLHFDPSEFPQLQNNVLKLADGRKVEVTGVITGNDGDSVVTQYLADGSIDTTFGTAGSTSIDFGSIDDRGMALARLPDGSLVLAGYSSQSSSSGYDVVLAKLTPPTDSDGVSDTVEAAAPNSGDGNNDGVQDNQQANVTSLPSSAPGAEYLTLASPSTTTLDSVQSIANPSPSTVPPGVDFPIGHLNFEVSGVTVGGATTVTLYVPSDSNVNTYYKYGPTPDNATPHWYQFLYDG